MTPQALFSIASQDKSPVNFRYDLPNTSSRVSPTDLHHQFVKFFHERRMITNKMMVLLPQIEKSKIYQKYGCENIFEYAFRFGKFSRELTLKALRTWKSAEDKPYLQKLIAEQGVHKVAMVVNLATSQTDKIFAEHVVNMSKPALQEFAKELRQSQNDENSSNPDPKSESFENSQKCHCAPTKMIIELDSETQILFNQLKHQYARNFSNQQSLKILLEKLKEFEKELAELRKTKAKKAKIKKLKTDMPTESQKLDVPGDVLQKNIQNIKSENFKLINKSPKIQKTSGALRPPVLGKMTSRHIPAQIKRSVINKTAGKCAYPNCTKPIENFHHRIPFAAQIDNQSIVGLCKIHHEFAHNGIIKHELSEPEKWTLNLEAKKTKFDEAYLLKKNVE